MIPSRVFLIEILLFLFSLGLHIALWRWRRPKHQALTLTFIFLLMLLVGWGTFGFFFKEAPLSEWLAIGLFHVALACAYLQTYPVLQAASPSLAILLYVGESAEGFTEWEIHSRFRSRELLAERIDDLFDANLVRESGTALELTGAGRAVVLILSSLRKALGLPPGLG